MLAEGTSDSADVPHSWKRFSGAMVRQAVDEAVSSLPSQQKQLIKLERLGMTIGSVERGLRQAIARVSDYVERGRSAGRRALYALVLFLFGRQLGEALHQTSGAGTGQLVKACVLIVVAATAGTVLATQPAAPPQLAHVEVGSIPAIASTQPYAALQKHAVSLPSVTTAVIEKAKAMAVSVGAAKVAPPGANLPAVTVPISVTLPPLPLPPISHGLLGA